ncbi:helix-turn-helix domain-containing protein [Psychrobacter sp. AH5]
MTKQLLKAYKVRLYPNDEQKEFFAKPPAARALSGI